VSANGTQFEATYAVLAVMHNDLLPLIARRILPVHRLGHDSAPKLIFEPYTFHIIVSQSSLLEAPANGTASTSGVAPLRVHPANF